MKPILIDSNFLYALHDRRDRRHTVAHAFSQTNDRPLLVLNVVVGEAAYLIRRNGGIPAVLRYLDDLMQPNITLIDMTKADLRRVREIEAAYARAELDFADCCIMARSERLNITQVCTFDRRDFSIFRPKHCEFLELLP